MRQHPELAHPQEAENRENPSHDASFFLGLAHQLEQHGEIPLAQLYYTVAQHSQSKQRDGQVANPDEIEHAYQHGIRQGNTLIKYHQSLRLDAENRQLEQEKRQLLETLRQRQEQQEKLYLEEQKRQEAQQQRQMLEAQIQEAQELAAQRRQEEQKQAQAEKAAIQQALQTIATAEKIPQRPQRERHQPRQHWQNHVREGQGSGADRMPVIHEAPQIAVDDNTSVPPDLYWELIRGASASRQAGQHRFKREHGQPHLKQNPSSSSWER